MKELDCEAADHIRELIKEDPRLHAAYVLGKHDQIAEQLDQLEDALSEKDTD